MGERERYKVVSEDYDPLSQERNVTINNGLNDLDGCYMTIRQMTKDDMQAIDACLYMGQGEGCRENHPLIEAIHRALGKALEWEEE